MSSKDYNQRKRGSSENGRGWESDEARSKNSRPDVKEDAVKKPKITMGFSKKPDVRNSLQPEKKGIQMKLGSQTSSTSSTPKPKPSAVAAAFNADSDSEPEEMPPEAKMRMRNIGRETPTSAGPNSFGKTKQGFCDVKKVFEKSLKTAQDNLSST